MKNKKLINHLNLKQFSVAFTIITLFSACSNDTIDKLQDQPTAKTEENITLKETSLEEIGYNSIEEMFAAGWSKIGEKKSTSSKIGSQKTSITGKSASSETIREKVTAQQIKQLNLGANTIRNLFSKNGVTPDGVSINDTGIGSYKNLANDYGWFAYIKTGKPKLTINYLDKDDGYIYKSFNVTNNSNLTDNFSRSFSYTVSTTSSWNVSSTLGIAMEGEIGVPFVSKGKVSLSLAVTAGGGGEDTTEHSDTYFYAGNLPPNSRRTIIVRQKKRVSKAQYEIPVVFEGYVGLNFPKRVNGHYFWSNSASKLQQGKPKAQLGTISINEVLDIEIIGGPVELLSEFPKSNNRLPI